MLKTNDPAVLQAASAILGYATNKTIGKDGQTGAALAQYGTKWNELDKVYSSVALVYDKYPPSSHIGVFFGKEDGSGTIVEYDSKEYFAKDLIDNYIKGESPKEGVVRQIDLSTTEVLNLKNRIGRGSVYDIVFENGNKSYEFIELNNLSQDEINKSIDRVNYIESTARQVDVSSNSRVGLGYEYKGTQWSDYYLSSRNCTIFAAFIIDTLDNYGFEYNQYYKPWELSNAIKAIQSRK